MPDRGGRACRAGEEGRAGQGRKAFQGTFFFFSVSPSGSTASWVSQTSSHAGGFRLLSYLGPADTLLNQSVGPVLSA